MPAQSKKTPKGPTKGVPNISTRVLRNAMMEGADYAGFLDHRDLALETGSGLKAWLIEVARKYPAVYMTALSKLIPPPLREEDTGTYSLTVNFPKPTAQEGPTDE